MIDGRYLLMFIAKNRKIKLHRYDQIEERRGVQV